MTQYKGPPLPPKDVIAAMESNEVGWKYRGKNKNSDCVFYLLDGRPEKLHVLQGKLPDSPPWDLTPAEINTLLRRAKYDDLFEPAAFIEALRKLGFSPDVA